jgi:dipeptidyl aminopeptidase/acylaminoacyl peptidase
MSRNPVRSVRQRRWLARVAVLLFISGPSMTVPPSAEAQMVPQTAFHGRQTSSPGGTSATARQAAAVMTPELVADLRSVASAVVSPSGTHVAYQLVVPRRPFVDEDGPAWAELHVLDLATGKTHPFVTGRVNVSSLQWMPEGSAIAYLAKREGDEARALYAIPLAGGESRKLLEHAGGISAYSFSPDGSHVAFLSKEEPDPRKKELEGKGFKAEIFEEELLYTRLWIASLPAGSARRLEVDGHLSNVLWSPAGERIVVTVAPTPLVDDSYMERRIRVVDSRTGEVVGRIDNPGKLGQIVWSPDGSRIAFISAEDINDPLQGRLMVVAAQGGQPTDLLPGYLGHIAGVAWRDERTLVYTADEDLHTRVGEIGVDGDGLRTLVAPGGSILHGLTVSRDGRILAFTGDSPAHPDEVFVSSEEGAEPRRMTDSNPWLADLALAPQEEVTWRGRDGLELRGLLIRPLSEEPGRRYPLVVQVHGGPESRYDDGWLSGYSAPGQVAAARGMAVFYPNYRASTGRGVEFSKLDHGDMGGKEFDDIVDGVDHLIESGLVDPDRVGVTGGSYGGYATGWLTTRYSERFAAGVMFVGISNQISKVGTSDIPNEMFLVHNRMRPWEDWQLFLERSPVYWAGNSRTPLLILAGKDDPRVHPAQSLEMYRYLRLRGGAPVRLVFYPGEGHGNAKAAARYDYSLRALRWLEHYLSGPGGDKPPAQMQYPLEHGTGVPREQAMHTQREREPSAR